MKKIELNNKNIDLMLLVKRAIKEKPKLKLNEISQTVLLENKNGEWRPVGLVNKKQRSIFYPDVSCPIFGVIRNKHIRVSQEKDIRSVYCWNCEKFCNYIKVSEVELDDLKVAINSINLGSDI